MSLIAYNDDLKQKVGGQAVIEGVMMRSPNSLAVSVRRPDDQIVIKEQAWHSIWKKLTFLRKPVLRGSVVLVESLWNGISALTFSANHAMPEEEKEKEKEKNKDKKVDVDKNGEPVLGTLALIATIAFSFAFAMGLFVVVPHLLTMLFGTLIGRELTVDTLAFHAIDGVIKVLFFVGYVWAISFVKDIRRVFQYHGAEHMTIFALENGDDLTVENVRKYHTFHPRCGTSFIMVVLLISIVLFSILFPLLPNLPAWPKILRNLVYIAIKIPMMLPVAGISYELIKIAGAKPNNRFLRMAILPGLWLQRITTKTPDDSQLEIAILSMKKCLWREANLEADGLETVRFFNDFQTANDDIDGKGAGPSAEPSTAV
jgi:uncharacterized protein YqhQ